MDLAAASPLDEAATANPKHSEAPGGQEPRGVASYAAGGHGQGHDGPRDISVREEGEEGALGRTPDPNRGTVRQGLHMHILMRIL